jgi:intracellular septation protein A
VTTPETTHPRGDDRPGDQLPVNNLIESVGAVVVFIVVNKLLGLPWAIGAVTLWSLRAIYLRWRRGTPIGKFLPIVTSVIVVRGVIGIVADSEDVYFGLGIAGKVALGLALVGSVLIGRNLVEYGAPMLIAFDGATREHPIYRKAMRTVGYVAGSYYLASAAFDVWLYQNSSVNGYVLIRFLVNWPATMVTLVGCAAHLSRRLTAIPGFPGLGVLMERRMEDYGNAFSPRRRSR